MVKAFIISFIFFVFGFFAKDYLKIQYQSYKRQWVEGPYLSQVSGDVALIREGKTYLAEVGHKLKEKDIIITNATSWAVIVFGQQSEIKVMPNTQFQVTNAIMKKKDNQKALFKIFSGSIFLNIFKGRNRVQIDSPYNQVNIKGTQFIVHANKEGLLKTAVLNGEIEILNKIKNISFNVKSGEGSVIHPNGDFSTPDAYRWVQVIDWHRASNGTDVLEIKSLVEDFKKLTLPQKSSPSLIDQLEKSFSLKEIDLKIDPKIEEELKEASKGLFEKINNTDLAIKQAHETKKIMEQRNERLEKYLQE